GRHSPVPAAGRAWIAAPKVSMGEITAQCYHIFYDLTENLIEDIFAETTNGNGAMNRMSAGCQYKHPFQFYSDVPKIASARIVRKNPVEEYPNPFKFHCQTFLALFSSFVSIIKIRSG
ncbi:hypothetical protein ACUOCP_41530, partial [Escherichia sp. R-CC3]